MIRPTAPPAPPALPALPALPAPPPHHACYRERVTDVPIRPASTIVLLRDSTDGVEVFMVRRHFSIAFMAGAHVFPGGRVDASDADADEGWCDRPSAAEAERGPDLAFRVAALRELFEEAGVLLARTHSGVFPTCDDADTRGRFADDREAVHAGTQTLRTVIDRERLRLALDAVVPFAHWVTPPIEVRRFDTWFFAALMPPRQAAAHDTHESMGSGWFTPQAALDACRRGRINLPPPTWATLRQLEPFTDAAAVMAWARTVAIPMRQPTVQHADGLREILLPDGHAVDPHTGARFETRFVWVDGRWLPGAPTA